MARGYDFTLVAAKWQRVWEETQAFRAGESSPRPKYYLLEMYPYPSGKIHMGHVRNYTIGDALARYKRMGGHAVLHPMGFDAFGLPNEMEAARRRLDPADLTVRNIRAMRRQLKALGYSYDWRDAIVTINPR